MKKRIVGFDLARAYAVFGMFIVNYNTVFGSHKTTTGLGYVLNLFNGNSSSTFVILAGMGLALMTNRTDYNSESKQQLRATVIKRSWFLFFVGLLLYTWWPADILHFYGGYMHVAALLLFVTKRTYLWLSTGAVAGFHGLLVLIPYETGWNFATLRYTDFWTVSGFLRNTLYNGWNPLFPWLGFFLLGMWLGRLDWQSQRIRAWVGSVGLLIFLIMEGIQAVAKQGYFDADLTFYLTADYLPPFLPFMLGTTSFALVLLVICLWLGDRFADTLLVRALTATGQMTLTHYVVHLTLGMILFSQLSGTAFTGSINEGTPTDPLLILLFATSFFVASVMFSYRWNQSYSHGPLETLMRKLTG